MVKILCVVLLSVAVIAISAQNGGRFVEDGRWAPPNYTVDWLLFFHFYCWEFYIPRYRPQDDGRYRPSNEGKYGGSDGRYIHQDSKYQHVVGGTGGSGGSGGFGSGAPATPIVPVVNYAPVRRIVSVPAQPPTGWRTIRYDNEIDPAGYHYLWVLFFIFFLSYFWFEW